MACLETLTNKWASTETIHSWNHYNLPAYYETANIRSKKRTPQNSNQLAKEMELLGENQPRLAPTVLWAKC